MKPFYCVMTVALTFSMCAAAQQTGGAAASVSKTAHTKDGHPDLSGVWSYTIDLPPGSLKKVVNGKVAIESVDRGLAIPRTAPVRGALPATPAPSYKPEFQAKVKNLFDNESKLDPVFYCGKPGVPRLGPPRKIVQLPTEMVFFYEDISGDPFRIIPTDGRPHRKDANPSANGDSIGHWEGETFVVDVTNFLEDGWFGEGGYFHTDAMHVVERLWRDGDNLVWQATVEDPKVLTAPWTMLPKVVKPSTEPIEESPQCRETDGKLLLNNDHHQQR
jgi:hypothetical protein